MLILTIRSDKPEAEIGLYRDSQQLTYYRWLADRQLAETIHLKLKQLLDEQGLALNDLQGIVAYQGPGSFTGLRIGLSVANALAAGIDVPIVAVTGQGWQDEGINRLSRDENDKIALPKYGAPPHTTEAKK